MKEQLAAARVSINLLEKGGSSKAPNKNDDEIDSTAAAALAAPFAYREERRAAPKFHKLEFPNYRGEGSPLPCLNCVERFFKGHQTEDKEKVCKASYHLADDAALWDSRLEMMHGEPP